MERSIFLKPKKLNGVAYGFGAGVHWQPAEGHKISLGVEYAGYMAQPKIVFDEEYDEFPTIEKQRYVFLSVGYSFVF